MQHTHSLSLPSLWHAIARWIYYDNGTCQSEHTAPPIYYSLSLPFLAAAADAASRHLFVTARGYPEHVNHTQAPPPLATPTMASGYRGEHEVAVVINVNTASGRSHAANELR